MVKGWLIIFSFILMLPLIVSALPFQSTISNGIQIEVPSITVYKLNQQFDFNFHAFNISNGMRLDNTTTTCFFHLFNSTGTHVFPRTQIPYDTTNKDFEIIVKGGNFTEIGEYYSEVSCNATNIGGFSNFEFSVTGTGSALDVPKAIIYIGALTILVFLFILSVMGFGLLRGSHNTDERGNIISMNYFKYFKSTLFVIAWGFLIMILYTISALTRNYFTENLSAIFFMLFRLSLILAAPILVFYVLWIIVNAFDDRKIKQLVDRGVGQNINFK